MRISITRLFVVLLLPTAAALLAGCGDSSTPPPSPPAQAQAPAPAENNNVAAEPEQPAARRPAIKPVAAAEPEPPAIDPATNPHDVFEVTATVPTFERAEGPDGPVSMNKFDATFPAKGTTSSDFELTEPPQEEPAPSQPKVEETPPPKKSEKPSPGKSRTTSKSATKKKAAPKETPVVEAEKSDSDSKKTLPSGFSAIASYGYSPLGWPLRIRSRVDGAEMAFVTGGAVTLGHDGDPPESSPQITVVLDSFYMDVTEVTLARYERYRKQVNEEHGRHSASEPENAKSPANYPVLGVTLKQAEFYAHWAQKELPTEAEWERAARGEQSFPHPWGNGRAIWSQSRKPATITAVKSFPTDVSPFGLYDLAGNAREWCTDRWSPTAFADASKSSQNPLRSWKGPKTAQPADFHVVKGNGPGWNAWYRAGVNGLQRHADVGFRCMLRLNEKN